MSLTLNLALARHQTLAGALLSAVLCVIPSLTAAAAEKPGVVQTSAAARTQPQAAGNTAAGQEATVSINQASAEQLADTLNGVGLKKAEAIVRYREQNGPFTDIEQLQEVPGIGLALLERNRERLRM
ncbi:ComEA family DNA-binding protein [Serratia rhizosphaerae]|uniref:ComEA family DNA-binding protein n=1 Tax=unclassified Serratia (in: enterobacteria) TaxID=2647522 RepID=UPI000CF6C0DF|nr:MULTISPECIES: helix-hairpin-helix domain-containing protein [unclassified Serratia (in: enterobacteria)]MBU3893151.1 helix-hairpin-helix domain-containing protein [Serratia rubidaea]AVJ16528.1 competence protein ComEA [Serratia sp. MYb239]MCA4821801.1 helix-hairpin-helix domain-containing protein [Serratia rubidaea]QNK31530.1 helix-hairpin-helix domain-containing protein [Serratia sp. JUb9]QPT14538.1 helix-hairpin-helix domain-containing protein [Serratia rubidaea]